ncbi:Peptidase C19 ubiquitin carboxyl-terminal hydrolase, partial [Perkinsus sp. BL_2016]
MTKSFGWDTTESFMQHDVQEFSRVLMDDLENKMKGSEVEGTVERLFRGKMKNVLKCTQVEYESVREESFYDLQLTIKGVKDLKESFERYVAAEMLSGDNQYRTDDFGLQDAKKFATFEHFPPVLHVHLERYAFDMIAEATVKIHDRFEFPTEIDLGPYLSETSPDRSVPQNYWLHSVLVHAGDGHGGHYFVYIRHPSKPNCWYKFDDTKVTPCTQNEAIDENFGGYEAVSSEESNELYRSTGIKPYRYKKFTSAYLLVYIRKCDLDTVMAPVEESHVPEYLVNRIKRDDIAESRRRYERQQQFLNMTAKILTDESFKNYSGPDLCDPDSNDFVYKCRREANMEDICVDAIKTIDENSTSPPYYYGCDGYECYTLSPRRNKTIRPDIKLTELDSKTVGSYHSRIN